METIQGFSIFANERFIIFMGLALFVPFWGLLIYSITNQKNDKNRK